MLFELTVEQVMKERWRCLIVCLTWVISFYVFLVFKLDAVIEAEKQAARELIHKKKDKAMLALKRKGTPRIVEASCYLSYKYWETSNILILVLLFCHFLFCLIVLFLFCLIGIILLLFFFIFWWLCNCVSINIEGW